MKYQLPCGKCGAKLVVGLSEAGQSIACRCGAQVEVPSWREIRALQPAVEAPDGARRRAWSRGRGVLFAAAMVLAAGGLLVAGATGVSYYMAKPPPRPSAQDIKAALAETQTLTPTEAWEAWTDMRDHGLGAYYEPAFSMFERSAQRVFSLFIGGLVALAVGAVVAGWVAGSPRTRP